LQNHDVLQQNVHVMAVMPNLFRRCYPTRTISQPM